MIARERFETVKRGGEKCVTISKKSLDNQAECVNTHNKDLIGVVESSENLLAAHEIE